MKKMKTLFEREFKNHNVVKCLNKMQKGCEWVLREDTYATEKIDGTCCLIKDNKIYKRFDLKPGRNLPNNAIPLKDKLLTIINHFGIDAQQKQLAEENFELQEAIMLEKYKGGRLSEIVEELADNFVLLYQIMEYYEISKDVIELEMSKKIERTLERIESGYYER